MLQVPYDSQRGLFLQQSYRNSHQKNNTEFLQQASLLIFGFKVFGGFLIEQLIHNIASVPGAEQGDFVIYIYFSDDSL